MAHVDDGILASKLKFLLLTFAVASFVIIGMMAVGSAASSADAPNAPRGVVERGSGAGVSPDDPFAPPSDEQDRVVTAQRAEERELPVPPARKGADSSLYLPNIADIVERANPAVVNIRATEIIRAGSRRRRSVPSEPFEFFFPRPDGRTPRGEQPDDDQRQDSGGSGFVVTDDGFIMTNYHVIEDADRIVVRLAEDSKEYEARVIGTDELTDLALLKIEPSRKLPTLTLGNSEQMRVGDWVIAIGNPLVYDHTVTVGVVSAKGRRLQGLSRDPSLDNYIQTDAAINRGNSGGPLLNLRGEAIGINSAISVAGQGISFAIPINMARDVMAQLRESGSVSRGFLGVTIQDIQSELRAEDREFFRLASRKGAFIQSVTEGHPADLAGLKPGDAIVSVDGKPIEGSDDLIRTISAKRPGATVALGIVRDGKETTLQAELTNRPGTAERASGRGNVPSPPDEPASDQRLGITVEEITEQARAELRIPPELKGVLITRVSQVSNAWERGLREGDVISEVNRQPVRSLRDYRAIVDRLSPGDVLALYVTNAQFGASRFVTLRVGTD